MALTDYSKNKMLDHLLNDVPIYVAGMTSGVVSGEITTARQVIDFATAASGKVIGSTSTSINVLAGTTISHLGLFDLATGGNLIGIFSITTPETFSNDGKLDVTGLEIILN